ncbi:MAG: CBS domain-containing protein [Spirochaetaceae bacterium]
METVREILRHKGNDVWSIHPQATTHEALERMREKNVGALLVIDSQGTLQGIFSERDLARHAIDHGDDLRHIAVSEVMTTPVRGVAPDRTVEECMAVMTENRVRHLPVFEDAELIGLISIGDVVKAVIHEKEFVIDQLEHYIAGSL